MGRLGCDVPTLSMSVSSSALLCGWLEAVELDTPVQQHSYQCQCQKFTGNVFTGQKEKNEFDFLKIQPLQVEIEKRRASALVENKQRGQREGTRRLMLFSNTRKEGGH